MMTGDQHHQLSPTTTASSSNHHLDNNNHNTNSNTSSTYGNPYGPSVSAELDWILKEDTDITISQLIEILNKCSSSIASLTPKQFELVHCSQNQLDLVKVNATLEGYRITSADIKIKLATKHPIQTIKTCIKETPTHPFCWRLVQVQDSLNHLSNALDLLKETPLRKGPDGIGHDFQTPDELLQLVNDVMNCLRKSRSCLLTPRKSLIEELQHSQNMQSISPALPLDFSISFYVQAPNLVCSVYQLSQSDNRPQVKAEYQAEVMVQYLSEMLAFLSLALQACQQLKDKIQCLICD